MDSEINEQKKLPSLPESVSAAAMPRWGERPFTRRMCPVCKNDGQTASVCTRPDNVKVHECLTCGMIYVADIPAQRDLDKFYGRYGHHKGYGKQGKMFWHRPWWRALFDQQIDILDVTGGIKNKSLLEVGASFGAFLENCRYKGAKVTAVEIDEDARDYLMKNGFNVISKIEEKSRYDIICAFHVVEHLCDPGSYIASMSKALKLDGRLLLSIPNAGEFHKIGRAWVGFRVDLEHINYFDLKSMGRLLSKHNLFIEHFWEHGQPYLLRNDNLQMKKSLPDKIFGRLNRILRGFFKSELANQGSYTLTILARKC